MLLLGRVLWLLRVRRLWWAVLVGSIRSGGVAALVGRRPLTRGGGPPRGWLLLLLLLVCVCITLGRLLMQPRRWRAVLLWLVLGGLRAVSRLGRLLDGVLSGGMVADGGLRLLLLLLHLLLVRVAVHGDTTAGKRGGET